MTTLIRSNAESGVRLASPGNKKLGPGIYSWSLPAGPTCPGATEACALSCYAKRGHYQQGQVKKSYAANYAASLRPDFGGRLAAAVKHARASVVRVHASGDFYSPAYVAAWALAARRNPNTSFFWYTRSWRTPGMLKSLIRLASLPNVFGWWSEDRDTGPSPETPGVRVAFLVIAEPDAALVDDRADIVFRDKKHLKLVGHALKRINGKLVCPVEQGVERKAEITCSLCSICFTNRGK